MDVPIPSRCCCRDSVPASARNVRPRCPIPDLVASRRRRREEAATATLAARASAASGRNVRPRLPVPRFPSPFTVPFVLPLPYVPAGQRRCIVPSEYDWPAWDFAAYILVLRMWSKFSLYLGDHFCPLVSPTTARENRYRRMSRIKNKCLMKKGWLRLPPIIVASLNFLVVLIIMLAGQICSLSSLSKFNWTYSCFSKRTYPLCRQPHWFQLHRRPHWSISHWWACYVSPKDP